MTIRSLVVPLLMLMGGANCGLFAPRDHMWVAFDVSPDGKTVVFTPADGVNGVYLLDLQTRTVRQLTQTQGIATSPAFSPDGKEVAFAAARDRDAPFHLFVYSFTTRAVVQLTDESSASDRDPSYSSDGTTIVFARAYRQRPYSMGGLTWDHWDVATIGRDGSNLRRVTSRQYYQLMSPRFAAHNSQLLYSAVDTGVKLTLFRVSLGSSESPREISPSVTKGACGSRGDELQISRDGRSITFIADGRECYAYDVYVGDADVENVTALGVTAVGRYNRNPVFVPRTGRIMYLAGAETEDNGRSRYSLYTVARDGSGLRPIAGPALFDDPLHWHGR